MPSMFVFTPTGSGRVLVCCKKLMFQNKTGCESIIGFEFCVFRLVFDILIRFQQELISRPPFTPVQTRCKRRHQRRSCASPSTSSVDLQDQWPPNNVPYLSAIVESTTSRMERRITVKDQG